jgi:pimeloyl-ACP methyl ester carboxylesterase
MNVKATRLTGRAATEFAPLISVYDPNGVRIASSTTGGKGSVHATAFSFKTSIAGEYQAVISSRANAFGGGLRTGGYALTLKATAARATGATAVAPVEANPLLRMHRFRYGNADTPTQPAVGDWVPVTANDPSLVGKNVYVVVHGWAQSYALANQAGVLGVPTVAKPALKQWWDTIAYATDPVLNKPAFKLTEPVAPYMFAAMPAPKKSGPAGGYEISPQGMAWQLVKSDPNAVVVAYSWIDDSAQGLLNVSKSEALTSLNGARLATALKELLPSQPIAGLHMIGHSHGSKVATVAAVILQRDMQIEHLTILDSPETTTAVTTFNAANQLWFFLGSLKVSRDIQANPGSTFVDNYISSLDRPLGVFTSSPSVQQVVDVNLDPEVLKKLGLGLPDRHTYAPAWYAGGSAAWSGNPTPSVAAQWSPLVNPNVAKTLSSYYQQSWKTPTSPQFALTATAPPGPVNPIFTPLALSGVQTQAGGSYDGSMATLTGITGAQVSGTFKPIANLSGIAFDLQFTKISDNDQLQITVNTTSLIPTQQQQVFLMTGSMMRRLAADSQSLNLSFTMSLGSLGKPNPFFSRTIAMNLIPANGSTGSTVQVSNVRQFSA